MRIVLLILALSMVLSTNAFAPRTLSNIPSTPRSGNNNAGVKSLKISQSPNDSFVKERLEFDDTSDNVSPFMNEYERISTKMNTRRRIFNFPDIELNFVDDTDELMLKKRNYGNSKDLNGQSERTKVLESLWVTRLFRAAIFGVCWVVFPEISQIIRLLVGQNLLSDIDIDLISFFPAMALIYGSLISFSLEALNDRQKALLEKIQSETSLLAIVTQNILQIFDKDDDKLVTACQSVADHVRILSQDSNSNELASIAQGDPFLKILSLLSEKEKEEDENGPQSKEALITWTRGLFQELFQIRAQRLGEESANLPASHFVLISTLTGVMLVAFLLSTAKCISTDPPVETRFLFSMFSTVYVVFYNLALDLNNPFSGVYRLNTNGPASHLLQIRNLLRDNDTLRDKLSI